MSLEKIGRYEITAELGRGAMGVVYKATDPNIGRLVALKTMRLDVHGIEHAELSRRFRNEARAAGTLNHPNIVTIYDAHEVEGLFYIAMEYIEGETLQGLLLEHKALPIQKVIDYTKQIGAGLDYAHSKGIIHRDVKPANIMITPHGTVKIMDFGIAKSGAGLTSAGKVLGTPSYMSPEQVRGKPIDGRSDLFGLGVMLYEMVTGEKPFTGDSITTIIYKIVHEQPIAPRDLDATIHPGISAIVLTSLAKSPEDRYQTGAELAKDLDTYKSLDGGVLATVIGIASLTAPIPVSATPSALGTEAIYTAETAAINSKINPSAAKTQPKTAPSAERKPGASIPASRSVAAAGRSRGRGIWYAVLILMLLIAGASIYRTKNQRSKVSEIPAPPAPAAPENPAGLTEQMQKSAEQTAAAAQAAVDAELQKAGVNRGEAPGVVHKHSTVPEAPTKDGHPGGTLSISSNIPGAQIEIDGKDTGQATPAVINVKKGAHKIVVRLEGFLPASEEVDVEEGQSVDFTAKLKVAGVPDPAAIQGQVQNQLRQAQRYWQFRNEKRPLPGFGMVNIHTSPPGALISVNGRNRNKVTPQRVPIPTGDYQLTLTLDGYKPVTRRLHVEDGKMTVVNEILQPK